MESIGFHLSLIQHNVVVRCVSVKGPEILAEGGKHIPVCFELEFPDDHGAVAEESGLSLLVQPLQQVLTVMGILHLDNALQTLSDLRKQKEKKNQFICKISPFTP